MQIPELKQPLAPQEAVTEANRCLFCFDAPCTIACPTHIDVPRFIKKIGTGNLRGSADTILDANILGLSCSRVCPVEVLCEGSCVMHRHGKQPIEIGRLQRYAMEHFHAHGARMPMPFRNADIVPRSIACIGAGPASLACAAELRRYGHAVTILESQPLAGGLNTYGVADYKFRPTDSQVEIEFIRSLGVEFRTGIAVGSDISLDQIEAQFDATFFGVGLGPTEKLNIPGEYLDGVVEAVRFIAAYKTAPATNVGRSVVVIGGGNTGIDAAVAAKLLGAQEVALVYRRSEAELPAFEFEYDHAKMKGVRFVWRAAPIKIEGTDRVTGIELQRTAKGLQPVPDSNFHIACDMVIVALGQTKLARMIGSDREIGFTPSGCIVVNPVTGQTANPRYFAGGDCANGGREVVDAAAEGKRAGKGIAEWLSRPSAEARHG